MTVLLCCPNGMTLPKYCTRLNGLFTYMLWIYLTYSTILVRVEIKTESIFDEMSRVIRKDVLLWVSIRDFWPTLMICLDFILSQDYRSLSLSLHEVCFVCSLQHVKPSKEILSNNCHYYFAKWQSQLIWTFSFRSNINYSEELLILFVFRPTNGEKCTQKFH